jgi:hypothetical protein
MFERGYNGMRAYCRSKLAMVMVTFELAGRLDPGDAGRSPARSSGSSR